MSYKVYPIDLSIGLTDFEIDTMVESNFLTTYFSLPNGICKISLEQSNNHKASFINGSKIKDKFRKIYLTAPAQPGQVVEIYVGKDSFYEKETPVVNAQGIAFLTSLNPINYDLTNYVENLNNQVKTLNIPSGKNIKSITIQNLDTVNPARVGKMADITQILNGQELLAGEIFNVEFNPLSINNFISIGSIFNINMQVSVIHTL